MQTQGLLFIPDISGFTRFVTDMEIQHSRHIIQELLEKLIDSNHLKLQVSEIEGDAILFYKFGQSPSLRELYDQVEKMFRAFHGHLLAYERRRICQCRACNSAIRLSLKVITHYGEFTSYQVKNFYKLIGKDVIVAHQLLKNDINQSEYWLVTKQLAGDRVEHFKQWMRWNTTAKETETGIIPFHYTALTDLMNEITPDVPPDFGLPNRVKLSSVQKEIAGDIKKVFYTAVHFEFRHLWMAGVKAIEDVDQFLPGVGTRHRCVLEKGSIMMYTSDFDYDPDHAIVYSETDEKKQGSMFLILQKKGDERTLMTMEFHVRNSWLMRLFYTLFMKKKIDAMFRQSIDNLEKLLPSIEVAVEF